MVARDRGQGVRDRRLTQVWHPMSCESHVLCVPFVPWVPQPHGGTPFRWRSADGAPDLRTQARLGPASMVVPGPIWEAIPRRQPGRLPYPGPGRVARATCQAGSMDYAGSRRWLGRAGLPGRRSRLAAWITLGAGVG
jgi:hypothetical protein